MLIGSWATRPRPGHRQLAGERPRAEQHRPRHPRPRCRAARRRRARRCRCSIVGRDDHRPAGHHQHHALDGLRAHRVHGGRVRVGELHRLRRPRDGCCHPGRRPTAGRRRRRSPRSTASRRPPRHRRRSCGTGAEASWLKVTSAALVLDAVEDRLCRGSTLVEPPCQVRVQPPAWLPMLSALLPAT